MSIAIQRAFSEIQDRYEADETQSSFNAVITGESGTGKTVLLGTCRKPILIDSFDPGGTKSIRHLIDGKNVLADTRWEQENRGAPSAYKAWARATNERFKQGLFDHLGTYAIDSGTMWFQAIMNYWLSESGHSGKMPSDYKKHWGPQKNTITNHISKLITLPCDFILTGHLAEKRDEITDAVIGYRLLATGDLTVKLPLLFDEMYVLEAKDRGSKGIVRTLLTSATGRYLARSRLAANGRLETREPADIAALLEKVGLPAQRPLPEEVADQLEEKVTA